MANLPGLNHL